MPALPTSLSWALAVLLAVLAFGLLVIIHEAGHFAVARLCGMRVERFSVGFGPVLRSRRRGQTEWCLSAIPFGGYVKVAGMALEEEVDPADGSSYSNQPAWRRFLFIFAGPAMNYLTSVALAVGLLATVGLPRTDSRPVAGQIVEGSPAAKAGLQSGDLVLSIDGKPVDSWTALVEEVQSHPGRQIEIMVRREGSPGEIRLRALPEDRGGKGRLGVGSGAVLVRVGLGEALVQGIVLTNQKAAEIVGGLGQMISGKQRAELQGPVGIAQEMARSARTGASSFLQFVWFISIALAMFNLLPLPALDGGRLVFLIYEMVTRRRVNQKVENYVHLAGFLALFGLLIGVTVFGDLARLLRH
jgi:regulator of sigma E protease